MNRFVPFICGALLALTLATLLVRLRYELEVTRERAYTQTLLDTVSRRLEAQLERGRRQAFASREWARISPWHPWRLGPSGYGGLHRRAPPIPEATLRRALGSGAARAARADGLVVLGPFATEQNRDALVLARLAPDAAGTYRWSGTWAFVGDLMSRAAVPDMMRLGYRVELYDLADSTALYQTDDGDLERPVRQRLEPAAPSLELRAAPRTGWEAPLRSLSSSLLVLLAIVLWLGYELRRGRTLRAAREELTQTEARREVLSAQYGKALQDLETLESHVQLVRTYDTVTGLANRSALARRIEATLESMRQSRQGSLCVMAIGFDQMPQITNSFGTEFASRVLLIAADRMQFLLPSKELLFRSSELHLAVVLVDLDAPRSQELAQRIVDEIASPIALGGHSFMLHPSIGIAATASGYEGAETLLDHAHAALGAVPRDALRRFCLFDSATAKESVVRMQLEVDLDRAFEESQFLLEYEPFLSAAGNETAGFEALIRWNHPTEGLLPPGRFLPIITEAGMSHRLNTWVLREAARQASLWRRAGHEDFFINFNLTAEAFLSPSLAEDIGAVLVEFELPGRALVVELTEATLVQDVRVAARTLQRLADLGVRAWLDDFGTGYSSLSHLRTLPLRGVKIDRSFIERIEIDARDFGFVKALIDLISYLGMESVVEGIETFAQYELLRLTTCDLYQGYYFAHSMPASQAERWLTARTAPDREEIRA